MRSLPLTRIFQNISSGVNVQNEQEIFFSLGKNGVNEHVRTADGRFVLREVGEKLGILNEDLNSRGLESQDIQGSAASITSAQAAALTCRSDVPEDLVLLAGTVFNTRFSPHARDQWNAAKAILNLAEDKHCTLVVVPPMGTGSFDWPVRQAVVNWIYGAIRWCCQRPSTTNLSVLPVVCVPGLGDQKIVADYLRNFTTSRRGQVALNRAEFIAGDGMLHIQPTLHVRCQIKCDWA
jgi:hypothetical protein